MKKMMPMIAATSFLIAGTALASTKLHSETDKVSYAMGYKTGQAMKSRDVSISTNVFSQGLHDGYQGKKAQLSEKKMDDSLAAMQKKMVSKLQAKMKKTADQNSVEGKKFLDSNAKKPGVVTTKSGLQYKVLKKGSGAHPSSDDTVTVNYEGKLLNGDVFDSSYKRGKSVSFKVDQVIKGWQEALVKMKPGATWMLYIPSDLAYGDHGSFGKIGPNETLVFKVNLISVKK